MPGKLDAIISFEHETEWRTFVEVLSLDDRIPQITYQKYSRALLIFLLGWVEPDLVKAAELVALTALEIALIDRYADRYKGKVPPFGILLRDMVEHDGLSDSKIPMVARCGGSVVGRLTGEVNPSLREIRNSLAHGDPFDGLPHSGLIELVRDLIEYSHRDYLDESVSTGPRMPS